MPTKSTTNPGRPLTYAERKQRLEAVKSNDFMTLVRAADLDPALHFRFFDWRGADLRGLNLRGFDFTGARLHGAKFDGALIGPGPDAYGRDASAARFDLAEIGAVLHDQIVDLHAPAPMTPLANLQTAGDWDEYVKTWRPAARPPLREHLHPGAIFTDAPYAPEMLVVPAGSFTMGSTDFKGETPPHEVTIAKPFAVGRFTVTFAEWDAAGLTEPHDEGWGRGKRPVINVHWEDARAYAMWLSEKTGKTYRLLSEAEWEYCCRAGTTTTFAFGDNISQQQAQFSAKQTLEVGTFSPNAWGVHDMHGNVREWCADNWHDNYDGAPNDGSVRPGGDPRFRVVRGGSWFFGIDFNYRSSGRVKIHSEERTPWFGFRLARTL